MEISGSTIQADQTNIASHTTSKYVCDLEEKIKALESKHVADVNLANNLRRYFEISDSDVREKERLIKQLEGTLATKEDELRDLIDDVIVHKYTQETVVSSRVKELEEPLEERDLKIDKLQRMLGQTTKLGEQPDSTSVKVI